MVSVTTSKGLKIEGNIDEIRDILNYLSEDTLAPITPIAPITPAARDTPIKIKKSKRKLVSSGKYWSEKEISLLKDNLDKSGEFIKKNFLPERSISAIFSFAYKRFNKKIPFYECYEGKNNIQSFRMKWINSKTRAIIKADNLISFQDARYRAIQDYNDVFIKNKDKKGIVLSIPVLADTSLDVLLNVIKGQLDGSIGRINNVDVETFFQLRSGEWNIYKHREFINELLLNTNKISLIIGKKVSISINKHRDDEVLEYSFYAKEV